MKKQLMTLASHAKTQSSTVRTLNERFLRLQSTILSATSSNQDLLAGIEKAVQLSRETKEAFA